jgi:hypothetical protein
MSHAHTPTRQPMQSRRSSTLRLLSLGAALLASAGCGGAADLEQGEPPQPMVATSEAALTGGTGGCYVDTPAYDYPRPGGCFGLTRSRTVKKAIVFDMISPVSGYTYQWSGAASCSASSTTWCVINVFPGVYTSTVTIRDGSGNVVDTQSVTAELEYEPGM